MPIPYMGSKRKSAGKIFQTIKNLNSEVNTIVDLFCGGFAVSEYFLKNGWKVIANDKNKYVVALIKQTVFEGLDENIVCEFITRERFFDVLKNKDDYEDWYVGYIMCVWSFGNNQSDYLFGKNVEPMKKAGHELVINKNPDLIKELIPNIPPEYIVGILKQDNWHKRRMALAKVTRKLKNRKLELQQLERLQQLEQLEQLQQLERLQRLQQLELYSKDYQEVQIPNGAVIYCDTPYKGTVEYSENNFDHKEFWAWVREKSQTNKIYISEYRAPNDFKKILSFQQNSTLSGGNNQSQPDECLFTL
jgi:site-specific DNA-adenine methylase